MKKETNIPLEVKQISGTNYIILPDNRVARLLKPMTQNGQVFYNMIIDGKYERWSVDKLSETK
jgi:hypothetical protein